MTATCSIDGCGKVHLARGLCGVHYGRLRYHGDPLAGGPARMVGAAPADRLWSHVQVGGPNECWPWTASTSGSGYGQMAVDGRLVQAHRLALESATGQPIPADLDVDHTCHNADADCAGGHGCRHRRCCNPGHLEAVTHGVNVRRVRGDRTGAVRRCDMAECDRPHLARGLCRMHYLRWRDSRAEFVRTGL